MRTVAAICRELATDRRTDGELLASYVVAGGFTPELKPDAKGNVPGYIWYDAKERKPAELAKEIEEGLRRF